MSRMRTDLRPAGGSRRSPGKLPPVRNTFSPPNSARSHEWRTDMVRGLQLHATAPPSSTASTSSPKEEEKKPCLAPQQEKIRQNDNKELIEVYILLFSLGANMCPSPPSPTPRGRGNSEKWVRVEIIVGPFALILLSVSLMIKLILFMLRGTSIISWYPSFTVMRTQISTNYVKCGKHPENFQIIP